MEDIDRENRLMGKWWAFCCQGSGGSIMLTAKKTTRVRRRTDNNGQPFGVEKQKLEYCTEIGQAIGLAMCYGHWHQVNKLIDEARQHLNVTSRAEALAETDLPLRVINMLEEWYHVIWIQDLVKLSKREIISDKNNLGPDAVVAIERLAIEHGIIMRD